MRTLTWIMTITSLLLLSSNMLCGLWIRSTKSITANIAEGINFHMKLGIAASVVSILTIIVFAVFILKNKL